MTPNRSPKYVVVATAILGSATLALAQPQFFFDPLPEPPGGASEPLDSFFDPGSLPFDGLMWTVGRALDGDGIWKAVAWSKSAGQPWQIEILPNPFGNTESSCFGIRCAAPPEGCHYQSMLFGTAEDENGNVQPVVWTNDGGGWTAEVPPLPPDFDSGALLSGEAEVNPADYLVWSGWVDQAEGPEPRHAAAWQKDSNGLWTVELLPDNGPGFSSEAKALLVEPSSGVRVIGGESQSANGFNAPPCIWQEISDGLFERVDLPMIPGGYLGSIVGLTRLEQDAQTLWAIGYNARVGGIDFYRPALHRRDAGIWGAPLELPPLPGFRDARAVSCDMTTDGGGWTAFCGGYSYFEPGPGLGQSATLWEVYPDNSFTVYDLNDFTQNLPPGITLINGYPVKWPGPSIDFVAGTHTHDFVDPPVSHAHLLITLSGTDCNKNGEDDAIDLYSGTSTDTNGNGIPDECDCPAVPIVSPQGPRHLAITPVPGPDPVGMLLELPGVDNVCYSLYVGATGELSPYPIYQTPAEWGMVLVSGAEIIPDRSYEVRPECVSEPQLTCCYSHGQPGCNELPCMALICQNDPYCCETRWDHFCAAAAQTACPCAHVSTVAGGAVSVMTPRWGDIDMNNQVNFLDISLLVSCFRNAPGAPLTACDVWPCEPDGLNNFLDISQGVDAFKGFPFRCSDPCDHACTAIGGPGCSDDAIEACVCLHDPWCCTTTWDGVCVQEVVGYGCDGSTHDCCETGEPGCDDPAVEACVCAQRPECCTGPWGWDGACVGAVQWDGCGFCTLSPHSCCETGEPGCENPAVQSCVCAVDPTCCAEAWDDPCINIAANDCGTCTVENEKECECESFKFEIQAWTRGTAPNTGSVVSNATISKKTAAHADQGNGKRLTIDFSGLAYLICNNQNDEEECEGTIRASVDGTTTSSTHSIVADSETVTADPEPPPPAMPGGNWADVVTPCPTPKKVEQKFKYKIDLTPDDIPIKLTVKIKIELECENGAGAARTVTFDVDTSQLNHPKYFKKGTSDFDGDGLTGDDEKAKETKDDNWDSDGDGVNDKDDREPRNEDVQ